MREYYPPLLHTIGAQQDDDRIMFFSELIVRGAIPTRYVWLYWAYGLLTILNSEPH